MRSLRASLLAVLVLMSPAFAATAVARPSAVAARHAVTERASHPRKGMHGCRKVWVKFARRASGKHAKSVRRGRFVFVCTGRRKGRSNRHSAQARRRAAVAPGSSTTPGAPGPSDPFASEPLFVEPNSRAQATQQQWAQRGRGAEAAQIAKIASQPVAKWFGDWSYGHGGTAGDVSWWVGQATAAGALPVLVAYDIPWRDCGQYSSGGAASAAAYEQFISEMAQGIGARRAAVIVEPDALSELGCLSGEQQATYYSLLNFAVGELSLNPGTAVYLDAGNAGWQSAGTMASRLAAAGVARARGFSLNVSNFDTTASETGYGEAISADLHEGTHFVIDTSRNGRGPAPEGAWCNPAGRGLGAAPTSSTGNPLIDALLWIKRPGESDGTCNGGPPAGEWWPAYALELASNG